MAISCIWSSFEDTACVFVNGSESGDWTDPVFAGMIREFYPDARQIAMVRSIHIYTQGATYKKHSSNFGKIWAKQHSRHITFGENDVVLFMDDNEGISHDFLETVDMLIPHVGDETTKFAYIAGCMNSKRSCDTLLRLQPNQRLDVFFMNSWEFSCSERLHENAHIRKDQPKTRTFLSFNRHYRDPRVMFVGLLKYHGLMKKGFVSVGATFSEEETKMENWDGYWINQIAKFPDYYNKWNTQLIENIKAGWKKEPQERHRLYNQEDDEWWLDAESYSSMEQDHPDVALYESSHLFVVTETGFQTGEHLTDSVSEDTHFLTEKTYRQIGLRMPIIVVGRPGIMAQLEKEGYQSYHPYIDQTYDTLENDGERMQAIIDELIRLSNFTEEQWKDWHEAVDKIADFNYNVLEAKDRVMQLVMSAGTGKTIDGPTATHGEYRRRRMLKEDN